MFGLHVAVVAIAPYPNDIKHEVKLEGFTYVIKSHENLLSEKSG